MAQQVIYNTVVDYYKHILLVYNPPKPLRVNINSEVEIGKFYLIVVLFRTLSKLVAIASKLLPLIKAAPISIAVFNINSQTIYNLLKLPIQHLFKDLLPISLIVRVRRDFKVDLKE